MTEQEHRPPRLDARQALPLVQAALGQAKALADGSAESVSETPGPRARIWQDADPRELRSLPAGVTQFAWLADGQDRWLWCDTAVDSFGMGQAVIDLPAGRYLVDSLDTSTCRWTSRESAEGSPLVVGITLTGRPVLLHVGRFPASRSAPVSSSTRN